MSTIARGKGFVVQRRSEDTAHETAIKLARALHCQYYRVDRTTWEVFDTGGVIATVEVVGQGPKDGRPAEDMLALAAALAVWQAVTAVPLRG